MKQLLLVGLLLLTCTNSHAQNDLKGIVKQVNGTLFMNNMESEPIYIPTTHEDGSVSFVRNFEDRATEDIQQTYKYQYLANSSSFLLEIKLDKRRVPQKSPNIIEYSDFGFRVFSNKNKEKKWKEVTLEVLPPDFLFKAESEIKNLQKGYGIYFYNLDMAKLVEIDFSSKHIAFTEKGEVIMKLQWRKNKFVWK